MAGRIELDVIIPSFRINGGTIKSIIKLSHPQCIIPRYTIVIDNPDHAPSMHDFYGLQNVNLIFNQENLGAPMSRNVGLDSTNGEWVLFLDDDVVPDEDILFQYSDFIKENGAQFIGAVGMTKFPLATNSFTKGLRASDILTFFEISRWYRQLKWGVTANILIKRTAIGSHRFSNAFPKHGGGEDIDLFLRCVDGQTRQLKCLPKAKVTHGWWVNGKREYTRFFRWAYGDGMLPKRFPKHRYWNLPNMTEMIFLWLIASPLVLWFGLNAFLLLLIAFLLGEVTVEYLKQAIQKQNYNPLLALESAIVRTSNDIGRLCGNLARLNFPFISERFDYFCDGRHVANERLWAGLKFSGFIISLLLLFIIYERCVK